MLRYLKDKKIISSCGNDNDLNSILDIMKSFHIHFVIRWFSPHSSHFTILHKYFPFGTSRKKISPFVATPVRLSNFLIFNNDTIENPEQGCLISWKIWAWENRLMDLERNASETGLTLLCYIWEWLETTKFHVSILWMNSLYHNICNNDKVRKTDNGKCS